MTSEEKRAWVLAIVSAVAYAAYVVILLGRSRQVPLSQVAYASTLLWSIGAAIAASIVLHIASNIGAGREGHQKDQRDREIQRFGDHVGQSFVIVAGVVALALSLGQVSHFWIANVIYLGFVLSAILGSTAKIAAYRVGFHPW